MKFWYMRALLIDLQQSTPKYSSVDGFSTGECADAALGKFIKKVLVEHPQHWLRDPVVTLVDGVDMTIKEEA